MGIFEKILVIGIWLVRKKQKKTNGLKYLKLDENDRPNDDN